MAYRGRGENIVFEGRVEKKWILDKFIEPCISLIRTFFARKHRKYLGKNYYHVIHFIFRAPELANPVLGNVFFFSLPLVFAVHVPEPLFRPERLKPHISTGGEPVNIYSSRGCQYFFIYFTPIPIHFTVPFTSIHILVFIFLNFFLSQFFVVAFRFSCCFSLFYINISVLLT